jgi:hypothetical protein
VLIAVIGIFSRLMHREQPIWRRVSARRAGWMAHLGIGGALQRKV